jgi:polar amino acid transport system substrate-binding protein
MEGVRSRSMPVRLLFGLLLTILCCEARAGTLVLAATNTHPTAFLVDGKPSGILVDLVTEAFRREGHSVSVKLMPWARCLESARVGQVDGVFSSFRLPEREQFLDFPKEALSAQSIVFFARKDSQLRFEGGFGALRDVRIGVILGTSYGEKLDLALRDGTFRSIDKSNSIESSLRKLVLGRVDLVPSFRDVAEVEAKRLELFSQISPLPKVIETVPTYIAFTRVRDMRKLSEAFDRSITAMRQDGSYRRIVEKYELH